VVAQADRRCARRPSTTCSSRFRPCERAVRSRADARADARAEAPPRTQARAGGAVPAPTATPFKYGPNGADVPIDKASGSTTSRWSPTQGHYVGSRRLRVVRPPALQRRRQDFTACASPGARGRQQGHLQHVLWTPLRDSYGPDAIFDTPRRQVHAHRWREEKQELGQRAGATPRRRAAQGRSSSSPLEPPGLRRRADDEGLLLLDEARDQSTASATCASTWVTKGRMQGFGPPTPSRTRPRDLRTSAGPAEAQLDTGDGKLAEWIVGTQEDAGDWLALEARRSSLTALGVYAGKSWPPCDALRSERPG